ncbi:MFS general substrate transporter [Corynespora cassiicola Philippines]|uniref:MFS general substrate transporter n=1 Tax=Corynespora cassiicola Philippines TaxID=1448308 RepID=A0A2T2NFB1_CORCC|nr:MFS general substrate transporter [Corynespora cassiicola Philippines]
MADSKRPQCDCGREHEGPRPRTLSRDLIADIIADLELLREYGTNGALSPHPPLPAHHPISQYHNYQSPLSPLSQPSQPRASSIYSNDLLQQGDLNRIRRMGRRASTVESSAGRNDLVGVPERHRRGYSHDFVHEVMHAYDHAYDEPARDYSVLRHEPTNSDAAASTPSRRKRLSSFAERFSRPTSLFSKRDSQNSQPDPAQFIFPPQQQQQQQQRHQPTVEEEEEAAPPFPSPTLPEQESQYGDRPPHTRAGTSHTNRTTRTNSSQVYPGPAKTALIMFSLYISIFLVALDRTILGPAIPEITNQFNSIDDIGWYGSAYMLTSAGFILLYGRVYTFFATKPVFLSGILLFEIGSAICGAANSSLVLIIGRAIAGFGSSGIFTGAILIMLNTVPLHKRPMLQGLFGACFGVASVAGPLLGGAFTGSSLTWRWCFYINLPLGGFTVLIVMFFLHLEENKPSIGTWKETFLNLDPLGTVLFLPSITCLLLALEWGAAEKPWNDPQIIALLVVFAVLFLAFIAWQGFTRHTTATVPARIFFQRSVLFGGWSQFCVGSTMLTVSMYIPLWFQAIKGETAMKSGINMIPLVLSVVVGSIMSGGLVQKIGYYTPFMILGSCLMAVGTGLITTFNMSTPSSMWIGFQVILGYGVGCTMQHPNLAIQVVLQRQDVPTGTALLSLCQTLGGAVFVAVGQNLFIDKFTSGLGNIPGIDAGRIVHAGATSLQDRVPEGLRGLVLATYNSSLTQGPFFAALIVACLAVPAALGMEWRSVKEKQGPPSLRRASQDDEEMQGREDGDADAPAAERNSGENGESADLAPPSKSPALLKLYRQSGRFTEWMTARVNPDLEEELRENQRDEKMGTLHE